MRFAPLLCLALVMLATSGCRIGEIASKADTAPGASKPAQAPRVGARRTFPGGLAVGDSHICVLLDTGEVKCWADNGFGELGLGDKKPRVAPSNPGDGLAAVDLGTGRTAVQLATGFGHTCVLLDTGSVKCWGRNTYGQLGIGDKQNRGVSPGQLGERLPTVHLGQGRVVQLVTGNDHTCVILEGGAVKCWGANEGVLGLGDTRDRGVGPDEMGDHLPAIDLGTGRTAVQLAAGGGHTCAILDTGAVKCWGSNSFSQLGLGDEQHRGDAPDEMGDALPVVDLGHGRTAVQLTAGEHHSCAILDTGAVKCWGHNTHGSLGLGDEQHRGDAPNEMGDALPAVDLGTGRTAVQVSAGYAHTCALLDDATLRCWGANQRGELGNGGPPRGGRPRSMGDRLPAVNLGKGLTAVQVEAGRHHTCAVLDTGAVKCWGDNQDGNDAEHVGDQPGEMGDALPAIFLGAGRTVLLPR